MKCDCLRKMNSLNLIVAVVVTLVLGVGFGSAQAGEKGVLICDRTADMGMCYEYTGSWWTKENVQKDCSMEPAGKLSVGRCSTENFVGTCVFKPQGKAEREIKYYFYAPGFTEKTAGMSCPGVFSPK